MKQRSCFSFLVLIALLLAPACEDAASRQILTDTEEDSGDDASGDVERDVPVADASDTSQTDAPDEDVVEDTAVDVPEGDASDTSQTDTPDEDAVSDTAADTAEETTDAATDGDTSGPVTCNALNPCDGDLVCERTGCGELVEGTCVEPPAACDTLFDPVCGCDGKTYGNDCERASAGVALDYKGECAAPDACSSDGATCAEGSFCNLSGCDASEGRCEVQPEACTKEYFPVCGCDGVTYDNDCFRLAAGVSLAGTGACPTAGGCLPTQRDACESGNYCQVTTCGDAEGACTEVPTECEKIFEPVCGCDGQTYGNACLMAQAGASLDYEGVCASEGCDATVPDSCGADAYCQVRACGATLGRCINKPTVCNREYAPVCGCDGQTYGNDCLAAYAGASIDYKGECIDASTCDPSQKDFCGSGNFCEPDSCGATTGSCQPIPLACIEVLDPVCGCDRQTYSNDCFRQKAGVALAYEGECRTLGCDPTDPEACGADAFCDLSSCGATTGSCKRTPSLCTKDYFPVCGCDGVTYDNDCLRQAAGASLKYRGECETTVLSCDATQRDPCGAGGFCEVETCGAERGVCQPTPTSCTREYVPVCGCNGQTYSNDCQRQVAGVSLAYEGVCRVDSTCDPAQADACPNGTFCELGACDDASGSCEVTPTSCLLIFDPVCGCDGQTYGNDCLRQQAGVSLASAGACESTGTACSTTDAELCGRGQFCDVTSCTTDGFCEEVPLSCERIYDPVCGCDKKTYANDCVRKQAGVGFAARGACTEK